MNRQTININSYKYIVEQYKNGEDISEYITNQYVMLRKFNIIEKVLVDTDIYFIDKKLFNQLCENGELEDEILIYPASNSNVQEYSTKFTDFNPDLTPEYIKEDVYDIYQKGAEGHLEIADVKCDIIRLYHPQNKTSINAIIHMDNYINGIHCHYYCRRYNDHETHTHTEFRVDKEIYSEYIEFAVPNIEDLFSQRLYFNDDTSYTETSINPIDNENGEATGTEDRQSKRNNQYVRLEQGEEVEIIFNTTYGMFSTMYLLTIPFIFDEDENGNRSKYYDKSSLSGVRLNYTVYPINITLYPYDTIDDTGRFLIDEIYAANKDTFVHENKFELSATFGFNEDNQPCIITKWMYPKKGGKFYKGGYNVSGIDDFDTFEEAYQYFYDVDFSYYGAYIPDTMSYDMTGIRYGEKLQYDRNGNPIDIENYDYVEELEDYTKEVLDDKRCGFEIQIASDMNFTKLIHHDFIWDNKPDDFSFNILNIFESWYEVPEIVVARTIFVDKNVGISIPSNVVLLDKDKLKYIIWRDKYVPEDIIYPPVWKNTNAPIVGEENRDNIKTEDGTSYIKAGEGDGYIIYNKKIEQLEMDAGKFNFIDKITCVIKSNEEKEETKQQTVSSAPKLLYKPIFYRVADLQNINIRSGLIQNIGINLADYMTKVETFKLSIGDYVITEFARNDVFVIFKVQSNSISGVSGTYHILNQDDEYISSGNWTMIN